MHSLDFTVLNNAYSVPVTIEFEYCGNVMTSKGTVTQTKINNSGSCIATPCKSGNCDSNKGCVAQSIKDHLMI